MKKPAGLYTCGFFLSVNEVCGRTKKAGAGAGEKEEAAIEKKGAGAEGGFCQVRRGRAVWIVYKSRFIMVMHEDGWLRGRFVYES